MHRDAVEVHKHAQIRIKNEIRKPISGLPKQISLVYTGFIIWQREQQFLGEEVIPSWQVGYNLPAVQGKVNSSVSLPHAGRG